MKRSEMLRLIAEELKSINYASGGLRLPDSEHINDADKLLSLIEEVGMKPPVVKRCPVLHTDSHGWEDEGAD